MAIGGAVGNFRQRRRDQDLNDIFIVFVRAGQTCAFLLDQTGLAVE